MQGGSKDEFKNGIVFSIGAVTISSHVLIRKLQPEVRLKPKEPTT